jgi:hypothetical protein
LPAVAAAIPNACCVIPLLQALEATLVAHHLLRL